MSKSILMVGGPKHGQRVNMAEYSHSMKVAEYPPVRPLVAYGTSGDMAVDAHMTTSVYTYEKVGMGRRSLPFMRHESLSPSTAADAALDILFTEAGGTV